MKTIKCTFVGCTKTFNRPARLAAHLRSHNNERSFVCPHDGCDKSYFDQKHLIVHIKGSHAQEKSYECNWEGCTKTFLTATRLRRHLETHDGHDRFRCTDYPPCNQAFRKHATLERHIRSNHLDLCPYPCTYIDPLTSEACNAGFDGATGLRKHEDRVHGLPRFFCPKCTLPGVNADGSAIHLGFTTDTKLQNHLKKTHAECSFCHMKCSSPAELQKHVDSQHSGMTLEERKNVACTYPECTKTFTKKYNRDSHVRTQHEGSRFICGTFDVSHVSDLAAFNPDDACEKEYYSKANLEDHIRTAHLNLPSRINAKRKKPTHNSDDEAEENDSIEGGKPKRKTRNGSKKAKSSSAIDDLLGNSYTHDPRRNIPCLESTCAHLFIRTYDLQQHMRTKHRLTTPEIEIMQEHAAEPEPEFQFPPGDVRTEDAYGGEAGEVHMDLDMDLDLGSEWDLPTQDLLGDGFWPLVGVDVEGGVVGGNGGWTQELQDMTGRIIDGPLESFAMKHGGSLHE